MVVCATGWELDLDCLPPTRAKQSFDTVQSRLFCRFWDIDYPGLAFVSLSNGFMCATENANLVSQAVAQALKGEWKQPNMDFMVITLTILLIIVEKYRTGSQDGNIRAWKSNVGFRKGRIQGIESRMGVFIDLLRTNVG